MFRSIATVALVLSVLFTGGSASAGWVKGYTKSNGKKNGDPLHDKRVNLVSGPVKTLCASYHKIQRITGTFVEGGPTGLRMLTELECKRIQGFPDNFKIPVCRTSMYHQFGNSVSVPVISAIAARVVDALTEARNRKAAEDEATAEQV